MAGIINVEDMHAFTAKKMQPSEAYAPTNRKCSSLDR